MQHKFEQKTSFLCSSPNILCFFFSLKKEKWHVYSIRLYILHKRRRNATIGDFYNSTSNSLYTSIKVIILTSKGYTLIDVYLNCFWETNPTYSSKLWWHMGLSTKVAYNHMHATNRNHLLDLPAKSGVSRAIPSFGRKDGGKKYLSSIWCRIGDNQKINEDWYIDLILLFGVKCVKGKKSR